MTHQLLTLSPSLPDLADSHPLERSSNDDSPRGDLLSGLAGVVGVWAAYSANLLGGAMGGSLWPEWKVFNSRMLHGFRLPSASGGGPSPSEVGASIAVALPEVVALLVGHDRDPDTDGHGWEDKHKDAAAKCLHKPGSG
jgi:hypothetical protein